MNDVDSLKMELEATRHNRDRDVAYVMKQRDEARAEVERLTKERDALQIRAQEAEGAVWRERLRGADDPAAIPAFHAEKVLVDVAKAAARLGAEEEHGRWMNAVRAEEDFAAKRAAQAKTESATEYWDGRRTQAADIKNIMRKREVEP